jgi:hypothetical protein
MFPVVRHITRISLNFKPEEFVRKSSVKKFTFPYDVLPGEPQMKSPIFVLLYVFGTIAACMFFLRYGGIIAVAAAEPGLDTAKIESITGLKGSLSEKENTFKVSKPKDDVAVTVEQNRLAPFMGLTSWAAFAPAMSNEYMVMGDMVLFEDEVNPAMSVALDKGLEVTALHNHFFFDEPKVYFMHIGGEGSLEKLAQGVRAIFDKEKEIRDTNASPAKSFGSGQLPEKSSIDGEAISQVFCQKGDAKNGMYKVTIGREVKMDGCKVGNSLGVNTWAGFAGTPDDALVVGDFAVLENELQTVLKTLRAANINIVAIHQHMTGENPRMLFLHYYGRGKALLLAQGVKAAVNTQPLVANNQ